MKKHIALTTALLAACALPACAAETDCKDDGGTALSLSSEAHRTVEQDRLQSNMYVEATGKTAAEAQAKLNEKMQAARAVYSQVKSLKVSTGNYSTWKNYPPEPAPKANGQPAWSPEEREKKAFWQANQSITLDGNDREEVIKLSGALQQQGFAMQGLNFYLSREASDAIRDELTTEALKSIKARAQTMATALGMKKVRFVGIDTNGNMPRPMPYNKMMRAEMAAATDAAMPEPVAQGGESDITVNVTADVRLYP